MKLLTKHTDYAVRALLHLSVAGGDGYHSSSEIARAQGIPLNFLRGILNRLIAAGYLVSKEGVAGGVRLKAAPESISIASLIRLFQGEVEISSCMFRRQLCSNRSQCVLRKRLLAIERTLVTEFDAITIKTLMDDLKQQ